MAIENYNFVKYDEKQLEHLERHLADSNTPGSYFSRDAFPGAKSLVDYAVKQIGDYDGKRLVREIDAGRIIGYDSLRGLDNLPSEARVTNEPRGRDGYLVNIISNVEKTPTRNIVVVAGPLREEGKHGFYTIFPGINAPPFPASRGKLVEFGYEGEGLEEQVKINEGYKSFWDSHGFVAD